MRNGDEGYWEEGICGNQQPHEVRKRGGEATLAPIRDRLVCHGLAEHPRDESRNELNCLVGGSFGPELSRDEVGRRELFSVST